MLFAYSSGKEKIKSYWKIHFIPFLFIHETISLRLASAAAQLFLTLRVYLGCRVNRFTSPWHDFTRPTSPRLPHREWLVSVLGHLKLRSGLNSLSSAIRSRPKAIKTGSGKPKNVKKTRKFQRSTIGNHSSPFFGEALEKRASKQGLCCECFSPSRTQTREREEQNSTIRVLKSSTFHFDRSRLPGEVSASELMSRRLSGAWAGGTGVWNTLWLWRRVFTECNWISSTREQRVEAFCIFSLFFCAECRKVNEKSSWICINSLRRKIEKILMLLGIFWGCVWFKRYLNWMEPKLKFRISFVLFFL